MCIRDRTLWSWGYNTYGTLGLNDQIKRSSPCQVMSSNAWTMTGSERCQTNMHKNDGTMWVWGRNSDVGALGLNEAVGKYSSPVQLGTAATWVNNVGDSGGCHAVKTDGTLWTWGLNNYGALGLNQAHPWAYSSPKQVGTDTNWTLTTVYAAKQGQYFGIAGKTDGTFWSWGYNDFGELGQNDRTSRSSPVQMPGTWAHICLGQQIGTGVKTDGTLWAWGYNFNGSLGQNNLTKYSSPTQIPGTKWTMGVNNGTRTFATKSS